MSTAPDEPVKHHRDAKDPTRTHMAVVSCSDRDRVCVAQSREPAGCRAHGRTTTAARNECRTALVFLEGLAESAVQGEDVGVVYTLRLLFCTIYLCHCV